MNVNEYKTIIKKTAQYPEEVFDFGLAYSFLGLIGESAEYAEEKNKLIWDDKTDENNYIKEAGDVCWYLALMTSILDIDIEEIFESISADPSITLDALAEPIKKHYRDNKPMDIDKVKDVLSNVVVSLKSDIRYLNDTILADRESPLTIEEVLEVNYNKLLNRRKNNTIKGDGSNR